MSEFITRDKLPDLWDEILQTHWTFLETEESIQKLEERKKLEGCLREFLCIVPHDRKFFLPETNHVLKKSVMELNDFSAYKAMIGFESISQYANNLFTKPWRKEYRVIKMYSGFYQYEIKSNLVDADKLFEAMGYKQFPNQILMLDGPICPDQVTNVSRDAMAAYVECQIMKSIYSNLAQMQLFCSWLDIYNFRELHIGNAIQAVKSMAYVIQERKYRKEKCNSERGESIYSTIQPSASSTSQMITSGGSCPTCSHTCQQQLSNIYDIHHIKTTPVPVHPSAVVTSHHQQQSHNNICSIHPQQSILMQQQQQQNNVPVSMLHYKPQQLHNNYIHHHHPLSQMSHSRSLEHYVDHSTLQSIAVLPHRHSFDQPPSSHYDTLPNSKVSSVLMALDCLDGNGGSSINDGIGDIGVNGPNYQTCSAYNHPYNVSGNRYPLPYNISAQLNNQLQNTNGNCVGGGGLVSGGSITINHHCQSSQPQKTVNYGRSTGNTVDIKDSSIYGEMKGDCCCNYGKTNQKFCNYHKDLINYSSNSNNNRHQYSHNGGNKSSDQLIDFDERPTNYHHHYFSSLSHADDFETLQKPLDHNLSHHYYDMPRSSQVLKDLHTNHKNNSIDTVDSVIISNNDCDENNYNLLCNNDGGITNNNARIEKKSSTVRRSNDKYICNAEILEQYQKVIDNGEQQQQQKPITKKRDSIYDDNYEKICECCRNPNDGGIISVQQNHNYHPHQNSYKQHHHQQQQLQQQQQQQLKQHELYQPSKPSSSSASSSSTTTFNKNHDGVGSFESWDYVFQNLEKHGYNKDLTEEDDLLVQGLDLDLMNINGGSGSGVGNNVTTTNSTNDTKKRGKNIETAAIKSLSTITSDNNEMTNNERQSQQQHTKILKLIPNNNTATTSATIASTSASTRKLIPSSSTKQHQQTQKSKISSILIKTSGAINSNKNNSEILNNNNHHHDNNNFNYEISNVTPSSLSQNYPSNVSKNSKNNSIHHNNKSSSTTSTLATASTSSSTISTSTVRPTATTTIDTSSTLNNHTVSCGPNEWSCRFCTYLNPETRRICEMCCRSRDFILDATNTPTCV